MGIDDGEFFRKLECGMVVGFAWRIPSLRLASMIRPRRWRRTRMAASDATAEPHKVRTQMIEVLSIPHRLLNKKALKRSRALH